ncbi:MAG: S-layer homology domain-containing protein [Tepidibacter sp.]|jgi:hypothetical protein|uniref:S-layer homology domain-containing protein n=1 Tax=Tepidibacter sp. TaxID=2529387 RepID=UPI0025D3DA60|nr:S-layer homology domain-containing protein [Tepidibacter sp.]MCT4507357.1 S-layer homology domain-containing protein [Tepidibacter sp.]
MKRINGILLSILLIISLTVTSFAQINVNVTTNKNDVTIQGTTNYNNESATIQINDENKKVYFDQVEVDSNGKYKFKTKLDSNKTYKGYVLAGQEKKDFEFKTSKTQDNNEENKKTNKQVIKETLDELKKYYKNKDEFTFRQAIGYYWASDNKSSDSSIIKSRFKEKENLSLATDYANNIIGLIAGKVNPNEYKEGKYVTNLIKYQKPSGEFDLSDEEKESTQTAWSIIALDMAKAKYNVEGAVKALIDSQQDGKFEDIDRTGMCLMALSNHTDVEGATVSIQKAEAFLLKNKKYIIEDANACTISAVIQGLISVGENPLSTKWSIDDKNMVNSLVKYHRKNKFKNTKETEQTFMAVADLHNKRSMFTNKTISNEGYDKEQNIEENNTNEENTNIEVPKDKTVYISIKGVNGYIVKKTKVTIGDNDNALSVLKKVLEQNGIKYSIDSDGYVRSIDGLGEFDKGVKSGWMINVGGKTISSGAGDFTNIFGKEIEWYYTKNYTVDPRNTNKEVDEIIENVDTAISNEEYKDTYSKIIDKNSSEEDVLKATKNVSQKLDKKIDSIESEKEAKELVDDIEDISKIMKIAYSKTNSQEGYNDIAESTTKLTNNTVELYKKISDKDKKEQVYKLLGQNIGITIKIIDDIEDKEKSEKICDEIIKSSLQIENKIPVYFESSKNEVEIKLPAVFIKKTTENDIDKMNITSDIASFSIIPNTFDKEKSITLTSKKLKASELSKKQKNRVPDDSIVIDFKLSDGEDITKFKYPIEITIPYEKSVKNKDKVNVFYIKNDGDLESMGGLYNEKTKTVRFITNHFSKYFAKEYTKSFIDLENTKWAKDSVEIMASKGIVNGKEYNKFSPNDNITRAEFAALVTRMLKYQDSNGEVLFKDVNKSEWYYDSINAAYQNKLINGKSEDTFDPNGNITRQEMAKIIAKVLESKGYKDSDIKELNMFKDKENIAPWAKESISLTVKEKIINGMEDKTFAPNKKATRAQAAVMLYRLYKLIMK